MSDEGLMAAAADGLIDSVTSIRGMVLTARSQLESNPGHTETISLLRAVELETARLSLDLSRVAQGRGGLDVTID